MGIRDRLAHAFNVFVRGETDRLTTYDYGTSMGSRPDKTRLFGLGDKSIINSIFNRIAIDAAAIELQHVRLDNDRRFADSMNSTLNNCFVLEANVDQTARQFKQDIIETMLSKGVIAIVPVETTGDPLLSDAYDIKTMRVGEIVGWFPQHVRVLLYNEKTGRKEEITLPKTTVAIVENPFYSVMNEPNGTLARLIRKLSMLDSVDEQISSGKLDMIIQLPYVIKTDMKRDQAEARRGQIEDQMKNSKYGIAYTDGTEKITQLNRPVENTMLKQVEYLTAQLYNQLGLTESVFNGTATPAQMTYYYNRTIEPILKTVTEAMSRTFLSKTARTQGQAIAFYRDPFALIDITQIGTLADSLVRDEIMTANEVRVRIGMKPITNDPKADQLVNPGMPVDKTGTAAVGNGPVNAGELTAEPYTDPATEFLNNRVQATVKALSS